MKITITPSMLRGFRVVKMKAVINPSKKLGITRRFRKTWNVRTVSPEFAAVNDKAMFESTAKHWEEECMKKVERENERIKMARVWKEELL